MNYYDTFVASTKTMKQRWNEDLQEFVNKEFMNASTFQEDVEQEFEFGTLDFKPIYCRITSLVDAKTGQRINEDFKKIIFPNIKYSCKVGTRFWFSDNVWIAYSMDNTKTATSAAYLRRCNNTINTQDKYGVIHKEPCFIDYKVTENQIFKNYSIDVPSGRIQVTCQYNDYTMHIDVNTRMMFNGKVYKVRQVNQFDQRRTFDEDSIEQISFYADLDNLADDDNVELNIADYRAYNFDIETISEINGSIGSSGKIEYKVKLGTFVTEEKVIWESSDEDIATINEDGEYEIVGTGTCNFVAKMENNLDIQKEIPVNSQEEQEDVYTTALSPNINYIRLNKTQEYSIYEYKNSEKIDTEFTVECHDVPNNYYRFKSEGNKFFVTNLKPCPDILLRVIYTNSRNGESKEYLIELGGIM